MDNNGYIYEARNHSMIRCRYKTLSALIDNIERLGQSYSDWEIRVIDVTEFTRLDHFFQLRLVDMIGGEQHE